AGLDVVDMVLQPLASSEAVLTPEERELGVAMVDLGGGTTDLAIFAEGSIRHTAVLPIGGQHLTTDLAIGLRTPQGEAERLKIRKGVGGLRDIVSNPMYATGVGLILLARHHAGELELTGLRGGRRVGRALGRMRAWMLEFF